ncbi:alpha/beta fold hydrolase [Marinibactrum halimedae]|uniref:Acyl-CoA esterase n=1 Tax=Marinibactrum halimedae TaxID=1444977 RepID=A0AA37WP16_9GAMM|nr:alpha/beta fold hydrolase [Marinibactrum halimedae]MCD9457412.1 alpha/beta fold hydrolase [Marinibactrum halimedae]GLS25537.1 acyl-CoA esterase [Marinibactrum halimedae]
MSDTPSIHAVPLNSKEMSTQGEPLIMMHGLFGSLENLAGVGRLLVDDFRVISLDMRNHGRSPHDDTMTLSVLAEDVLKYMDEHRIEKAHLFGHSLGGKAMMEMALTYPDRVAKVVVGDIAPIAYLEPRHNNVFVGMESVPLSSIQSRGEADDVLKQHIQESAVRSFILKNLHKNDQGQFAWKPNIAGLKSNYSHIIGGNREDCTFDGDVLFIKGDQSDYILPEYREQVLQRFPNAQVKIIPNTGHWLHAEKPETFASLMKAFLKR